MTSSSPNLLYYTSLRQGYFPGEVVEAEVRAIDGAPLGKQRLRIIDSPGSGFAGQVYRAVIEGEMGIDLPPVVAIKALRPRSGWKQAARDGLFWISFQAPFTPRLREEAVRCGLLWQAILRAAAQDELESGAVARPLGYYWDANLGSYVELHEWIEGRPARYETDELLVARWLKKTREAAQTEMARKKRFMDALAALCRKIGAAGLARQYDWYTLVSQSNVLSRADTAREADSNITPETKQSPFVAVDCRVGLAFPFFLPFTPAHLRISLEGLRRGVLAHYDEVDLSRLDAYLFAHPVLAEQLSPLVDRLKQDDDCYRARLPDLWHTRARVLLDRAFWLRLRDAATEDWVRTRAAAREAAQALHPLLFLALYLLWSLPLFGKALPCLALHPGYRAHITAILTRPAYRRAWFNTARAGDLRDWVAWQRIPGEHGQDLAHSPIRYLVEKATCGWLPATIHRLLTDPAARRKFLQDNLIYPLRLLISQADRVAWLEGIIQSEQHRGLFGADRAAALIGQIREARLQDFARDLGFTTGLDIFSRLVYLLLAVYGGITGDFWPLGLAALGPIPPSGPLRLLYVLGQIASDLLRLSIGRSLLNPGHLLLARAGALLVCPWRGFGNLFPVFEISAYYPRLALLLAEYYTSRAVRNVPIFGGQGKLLEYAIFQLFYNLPVGIKMLLKGEG